MAQERVLLHKAVTLKDLKDVSQMENRCSVYKEIYKEIDYLPKKKNLHCVDLSEIAPKLRFFFYCTTKNRDFVTCFPCDFKPENHI